MTVTAAEQEMRHCHDCDRDLPVSAWYATAPRGKCKECRRADQAPRNRERLGIEARLTQLEHAIAELREQLSAVA
jgi:hypothetical protein